MKKFCIVIIALILLISCNNPFSIDKGETSGNSDTSKAILRSEYLFHELWMSLTREPNRLCRLQWQWKVGRQRDLR